VPVFSKHNFVPVGRLRALQINFVDLAAVKKLNYDLIPMKLYEFEGSELFRREGIAIPDYALASNPEEAREKAQEIGLPVVIKAQVLTGGRWVGGGVQVAESLDQVEKIAQHILGLLIGGLPVKRVMVAQKVETVREYYLGIAVDEYYGMPIVIISTEGGVSINKMVRDHSESVISRRVSINRGLSLHEAKHMAREVGLNGKELIEVARNLHALYSIFDKYDALLPY